jgi:hypothetical protein
MKPEELYQHVVRGRTLIVGEFRGARADSAGYVDQKTGEAIKYVVAIYLIECACRGGLWNRAEKLRARVVQLERILALLGVVSLQARRDDISAALGFLDSSVRPFVAARDRQCRQSYD